MTALLVAILFALGAFSILGQLRRLDLHQPSVISGFAHDDVLMKGIGVLLTHVPNLISLVLVLSLALSPAARSWMRRCFSLGGSGRRATRVAAVTGFVLLGCVAIAMSSWWTGTLFVVIAYAGVLLAWLRGRLLSPGALLATAGIGALVLGLTGTYLHPSPLPVARIGLEDGELVHGHLLGTGQGGEWYVVVREDGSHHVRVVDGDAASKIVLDEPTDEIPTRVVDLVD